MTRTQEIARLKTKIDAMRGTPRTLEIVAPPTLQPRELFLQIGHSRYQVGSIREAVDMHNQARDNADHGVSKMPSVTIVSNTGLHLYRISYNGRVWGVDGELTDW